MTVVRRPLVHLCVPALVVLLAAGLTGCMGTKDGQSPSDSASSNAGTAGQNAPEDLSTDIGDSISSVERYWADVINAQGGQFEPVQDVFAYDEAGDGDCGGQPFELNNAFFCPSGDFIAYDIGFVEQQYDRIGDAFVYYLLGHEYAHAVQARLGITHELTIQHELQADCMAGAYLGDSVRKGDLQIEDGDLDELLSSLALVGDQPGIPWFAEGAHGTGQQRINAFQQGSEGTADGSTSLSSCF